MRYLNLVLLCSFVTATSQADTIIRGSSLSAKPMSSGGATTCYPPLLTVPLGTMADTTAASTYGTDASYTPDANALVLAYVVNSKASAPNTPTFSGNGMTWTQVDTVTYNTIAAATQRLTVFRGLTNGAPVAGAGTAAFGGVNQTGCSIRVVEIPNVDTSGSNGAGAIVQNLTTNKDTTANPFMNYVTPTQPGTNLLLFAYADSVSSASDSTPQVGWNEVGELNYATPSTGLTLSYRAVAPASTLVTNTATSRSWAASLIEVKPTTTTCPSFTYYSTTTSASVNSMDKATELTGIVDGKAMVASFWIKMASSSSDTVTYDIFRNDSTHCRIMRLDTGQIEFLMLNAAGTIIWAANSKGTARIADGWVHVMGSCDLATGAQHIYLDGIEELAADTLTNDTIDFSDTVHHWYFCEAVSASIAEFYFTTTYLDLSNSSNRAKFISGGKPVDLGANAATPTGTQPLVCFRTQVPNFETNTGSGGNFTEVGTLVDGGTDKP